MGPGRGLGSKPGCPRRPGIHSRSGLAPHHAQTLPNLPHTHTRPAAPAGLPSAHSNSLQQGERASAAWQTRGSSAGGACLCAPHLWLCPTHLAPACCCSSAQRCRIARPSWPSACWLWPARSRPNVLVSLAISGCCIHARPQALPGASLRHGPAGRPPAAARSSAHACAPPPLTPPLSLPPDCLQARLRWSWCLPPPPPTRWPSA